MTTNRNVANPTVHRVAGNEGYEVNYFANKYGISRKQARGLSRKSGTTVTSLIRLPSLFPKGR